MTKPRFHSRVAKRAWMAFIALAGQDVRTTDLIKRAWPRKSNGTQKNIAVSGRPRSSLLIRLGSLRGRGGPGFGVCSLA
jgi:hypothetical protein